MSHDKFRRNSQQRLVILEELRKLTSHPTAAALYEIVRRRLPKLSLGTVYRNLDMLSRLGMVQRLELSGGETRFDGRVERHEHIRCVQCGRVDDAKGLPLDVSLDGHHDVGGYEIIDYRVEILGICPQCRGLPPPANAGRDPPPDGETPESI
jgi:Fe2+ or Zn2+ uptake regulation protein